jgi:tetratricopeptide (TPR) repeat protein
MIPATVMAVLLLSVSPLAAQLHVPVADRLDQAARLIREGRLQEADQQLTSVLRIAPNQPDALNLLGTVRAQQGKLAEAEALVRRALQGNNALVGAHMNLALIYLLEKTPDRAVSELKEVVALDPQNVEAIYKLSRLLLSRSQYQECAQIIEAARKSLVSTPVYLLVSLGDAYLGSGLADKAQDNYLLALNQSGNSVEALLGLAQAYKAKGDTATSLVCLSRAKDLAANSPDLLYKFGVVALKLKSFDDAKAALEQAVRLKQDEASYQIALGAVWLEKPELFEAEKLFRRAVQLQPGNSQAQMYLGYTLLNQKRYPEALEYLEKSVKGDPSIPETYYYLALIAQEQNQDGRAVELLEKAVQLSASYSSAHLALGSTYIKMRNYAGAQEELNLAAKLNPSEPKVHYQLALLYARLKDPKRAQEEMNIVEKLEGENNRQQKDNTLTAPSPGPPK